MLPAYLWDVPSSNPSHYTEYIYLLVPDARTQNASGLSVGCAQFESQSLYRLNSGLSFLYSSSPS